MPGGALFVPEDLGISEVLDGSRGRPVLQFERQFGLTPTARAAQRTEEVYADEPTSFDYFGTGWRP